ncbi:hypothetical protein GCM10011514_01370 [Emticicia aquatilis]|uniref:Ankyrin repeat domain-containing protein n=1 Tax=Emticicia aquatilis TaxID=1537369 RepID=A0A916YDJ3_9BACT|nr:ankyrin repeat domain-containing protein [Emticicia aquatilis]GGD41020.1 hypothetical protein GCM10011514_01370 [Emticicia aquatilis]
MKRLFLFRLKQSAAMLLLIFNQNTAFCTNITSPKNAFVRSQSKEINIHEAVKANNITAVKKYISLKKNLNEKDPMGGSSPLITACLYDKKEIAQLLIKAGADLNFQNNDGSTPLHVAAFFCKPEMVKLLLAYKANRTIKNKYGSTALQTVLGSFKDVKPIYEPMKQMLEPMGVKLDLAYIEKTRPVIAQMLK